MYEKLKKIVKIIVPKSIIRKNERLLRSVVATSYRGDEHECNICNFKMSKFISLENGNKLCPNCGSLPRTRRLWQTIENNIQGKEVLHFSPSKSMSSKIRDANPKRYITTDYEDEFEADEKYDIQDIDVADNSFDIVICYHVLEHIPNDRKAMKELYRVLRPNGVCYIQTPFKEGEIYENENIKTKEQRLEHFGQEDHLRIYSADGLKLRLEEAGFIVEVKECSEKKDNFNGFNNNETILIANKIN